MTNKSKPNFGNFEPLPSPQQIHHLFPATAEQLKFVENSRKNIIEALDAASPRRLMIVGPCSIHDKDSALAYATNLKKLPKEISESFLVVMRVYFEKPRTITGWKGMLYDPFLDGSHDMGTGLKWAREILLELASMEVPAATEFLEPLSAAYYSDLISWGCIGARTAESQVHRQLASGLSLPIAFKNSTCGNIDIPIQGIISARTAHSFLGIAETGAISTHTTEGNPHCHLALRGGDSGPNYDVQSVGKALRHLEKYELPTSLIIDCSHDNSRRRHEQQPVVFDNVLNQILNGNKQIRGFILESHLNSGSQPFPKDRSEVQFGVSLTDPCIDWATTEKLIMKAHEQLASGVPSPSLAYV